MNLVKQSVHCDNEYVIYVHVLNEIYSLQYLLNSKLVGSYCVFHGLYCKIGPAPFPGVRS